MTSQIRPMKADKIEEKHYPLLRWPMLGSIKYDGIRSIVDDAVLSNTLKPIRNRFVQNTLKALRGADGELIVGDPEDPNVMQSTSSGVMSSDGEPDFRFYVFDHFLYPNEPFTERFKRLSEFASNPHVILVQQKLAETFEEFQTFGDWCMEHGHEGSMWRRTDGLYKYGRSTVREGHLMKCKPFDDAEGVIVGFFEQMENQNEAEEDVFGNTKRTSHQENLVPKGTLGGFVLKNEKLWPGVTFNCGTGRGLTVQLRQEIWDNQDEYLGDIVRFKYQKKGSKDRPRMPIWYGFRHKEDIAREELLAILGREKMGEIGS